jgi:hypothetical protein
MTDAELIADIDEQLDRYECVYRTLMIAVGVSNLFSLMGMVTL